MNCLLKIAATLSLVGILICDISAQEPNQGNETSQPSFAEGGVFELAKSGFDDIASYRVGTQRIRPGQQRSRRFIYVQPKKAATQKVYIFFYDEKNLPTYLGIETKTYVVAYLPMSDFDDMYLILRTEKGLYVAWATDSDKKLTYITIAKRT